MTLRLDIGFLRARLVDEMQLHLAPGSSTTPATALRIEQLRRVQ